VGYKGVQVVKLLLADAADVDVRSQLHQHRGATWNSTGQSESQVNLKQLKSPRKADSRPDKRAGWQMWPVADQYPFFLENRIPSLS
jgi:hypothetical protein